MSAPRASGGRQPPVSVLLHRAPAAPRRGRPTEPPAADRWAYRWNGAGAWIAGLLLIVVTRGAAAADVPPPIGEEAYRVVLQAYAYEPKLPLDARIVERIDEKGEPPREKVVFRGAQGFYVPGYFQLPQSASGKVPCVLLLHGWSGGKANFWADDNYIKGGNVRRALLELGFAVFALDAQCHGDRIAANEYAPVNPSGPPKIELRLGYFTQQEIYIQTVIDYRRGLDYLATRSEIDAARIGLFGYSMGGTQTALLMAVEPRLKTGVACVVPADNNPASLIAPRNVARGLKSRSLLWLMGTQDPLCPAADAERIYKETEWPYSKLVMIEGEHKLPRSFVPHAVNWLKERL